MDTMILNHPVKSIQPLYSHTDKNSIADDNNQELMEIFGQGRIMEFRS